MKKLSVLLYLDGLTDAAGCDLTGQCLESISVASGLPAEQVQLILLNPAGEERETVTLAEEEGSEAAGSTTGQNTGGGMAVLVPGMTWMEVAAREGFGSVELVRVPEANKAQAWNAGLGHAQGEYCAFWPSSAKVIEGSLRFLCGDTGQNLISLCPGRKGKVRKGSAIRLDHSGLFELEQEPWHTVMVPEAYLVRRGFLADLRFREDLREEAHIELILRLLSKNRGTFWYEKDSVYSYRTPTEYSASSNLPEERWWYEESVRSFLIPFLRAMHKEYEGAIPQYLQAAVYYILSAKFRANLSGDDKLMMNRDETMEFYRLCFELLAMVDNEIICQKGDMIKLKLPRALRMVLLKGKADQLGMTLKVTETEEGIVSGVFVNDAGQEMGEPVILGNLENEVFNVQVINERNGKLELDGNFQGAAFLDYSDYTLCGRIEGPRTEEIPVQRSEVYGLLKCFGVSYAKKCMIHIEVPVEKLTDGSRFSVYVKHQGALHQLQFKFTSINSRLLTYSQRAYWRFDKNRYVLYRRKNSLLVKKSSAPDTLWRELQLLAVLLLQKSRKEAFVCTAMRLWYWLTKPFYRKKRIWITFDKLYKAGDNGEYFFQYCERQNDGVDCYYIINRDAPDYERLVEEHGKHILIYKTWRCRLMALRAEAVMATHAGTAIYVGIKNSQFRFFKDLYHADNICIQHGLSIQKIANFQNRLYANTKLYCLASPFERDNVAKPIYGYEPDMLKMTGLARYDGLRSKEQKQILITPTWRKNVVQTKGVGMTNEHNNYFKETAYYRIYNSLINDQTLITCAKELGYRIIFLLHPAMSAQIDDYDRNDYVELLQATGDMSYEKILTESSLMVTDYSGVQFDFAYQRKPIVYYHPDELPPHYTEGGLIYSTMGFGPICTGHEQIIAELCGYMKRGCRMKDEYRKRADQFFAFDDFRNAERIYQEVMKFESR